MPPDPFFSGRGLDRADFVRADTARIEEYASSPLARELVWRDGIPAIASDGTLEWQPVSESALFLGLDGAAPCFCPIPPQVDGGPAAFALLGCLVPSSAPVFAAALSLARWHSTHRFCASCGDSTDRVRGGWSRRCARCEAEHYPRVDPVVIMLAEHEGRILLGRQYHYPPGRYSALAGFVEVGESIEDAVARELKEEAGVDALDVTYLASQPWPFPSSLMIGCLARAAGDDLEIDHAELEDARWFSRDEVEAAVEGAEGCAFQVPPPHTIARTLLERWLAA